MSPKFMAHLQGLLMEFAEAAAENAVRKVLAEHDTPQYATAKHNPFGSKEKFLAACRQDVFRVMRVGRENWAEWSEVEAYIQSCAPPKIAEPLPSVVAEADECPANDSSLDPFADAPKCPRCGRFDGDEVDVMMRHLMSKPGRRRNSEHSVVYFVRSSASGLVKIGFSSDLEARVKSLAHSSGGEIEVLHHMPGTVADERALHKMFAEHRREGEWFDPANEIFNHIAALKEGSDKEVA